MKEDLYFHRNAYIIAHGTAKAPDLTILSPNSNVRPALGVQQCKHTSQLIVILYGILVVLVTYLAFIDVRYHSLFMRSLHLTRIHQRLQLSVTNILIGIWKLV